MGNGGSQVQDSDIFSLFRDIDEPVLTTSEIANKLPIGQRATLNRLQKLESEGNMQKKKVGAKGAVWWPSNLEFRLQVYDAILNPHIDVRNLNIHPDDKMYDQRRGAIIAAFEYLQKNETASRSDFMKDIFPRYKAGYEKKRAWWEKLIRPNFENLENIQNAPRGGKWKYIGD
jgi:hypothetical protein